MEWMTAKKIVKTDSSTNNAAGSVFNKVVLLEYIKGDKEKIKQTLIDHGFKKIYVNNNGETDKEYKRIAKKHLKRMLLDKKHLMRKI